ncbi:MAG: hypothetical protein AAFV97_00925 [Bacteroidota bacterium]
MAKNTKKSIFIWLALLGLAGCHCTHQRVHLSASPLDTQSIPELALQGLTDQMQALQNHFYDCSTACHTQAAFMMCELKQEMQDLQLAVHTTQQGLEAERTVLEKSRLEIQTQLAALVAQAEQQAARTAQPMDAVQTPASAAHITELHEQLGATLRQEREKHAHHLQQLTDQVAYLQRQVEGLSAPRDTELTTQLHALAGQVQQWASHMRVVGDEIGTRCQQAVHESMTALGPKIGQLLAQQTEALKRSSAHDLQGVQKQLAQISAELRDITGQLQRDPSEASDKENRWPDPYMTPTTPPLQELNSAGSSPTSSQKREQYTATMSSLQHKNNILQGRIQQLVQKNEELKRSLRLARSQGGS